MKRAGYVPDVRWAFVKDDETGEQEKEIMLAHHSEKLAVAFGLLFTKDGEPLLVVKNLRICGDCHNAIKLISSIAQRKITSAELSVLSLQGKSAAGNINTLVGTASTNNLNSKNPGSMYVEAKLFQLGVPSESDFIPIFSMK
ncbi:hypothetical protein OIU78_016288 [Salix suchowensis]|nr:hypothetical protein OIU78_016288 [Salix suchowensis]